MAGQVVASPRTPAKARAPADDADDRTSVCSGLVAMRPVGPALCGKSSPAVGQAAAPDTPAESPRPIKVAEASRGAGPAGRANKRKANAWCYVCQQVTDDWTSFLCLKICCPPLSGIGIPLDNPDGNPMESSPE